MTLFQRGLSFSFNPGKKLAGARKSISSSTILFCCYGYPGMCPRRTTGVNIKRTSSRTELSSRAHDRNRHASTHAIAEYEISVSRSTCRTSVHKDSPFDVSLPERDFDSETDSDKFPDSAQKHTAWTDEDGREKNCQTTNLRTPVQIIYCPGKKLAGA